MRKLRGKLRVILHVLRGKPVVYRWRGPWMVVTFEDLLMADCVIEGYRVGDSDAASVVIKRVETWSR